MSYRPVGRYPIRNTFRHSPSFEGQTGRGSIRSMPAIVFAIIVVRTTPLFNLSALPLSRARFE